MRLARGYEALGNTFEAQKVLVQGLRRKELVDHFGLADQLISLQTEGKGLQGLGQVEFDAWLKHILIEDTRSAELMTNLQGAWKKRCEEYQKKLHDEQ